MKRNSNMNILIVALHIACWLIVTVTAGDREVAIEPIGYFTLTNARGRVEDITKSCSKPGSQFFVTFTYDGTYANVYTKFLIYGLHSKEFHLILGNECNIMFIPISDRFYSVEGICPMDSVQKGSKATMKVINFEKLMTICKIDMQPDKVMLLTSDDVAGPYIPMKHEFNKDHKDSNMPILKPLDMFNVNFEQHPHQQQGRTTRRPPIRVLSPNKAENGEKMAMNGSFKMNEKKIMPEDLHVFNEKRASSKQEMPPILKD